MQTDEITTQTSEAEIDEAFMDRMWGWLEEGPLAAQPCSICGAVVPTQLARGEYCIECAAQ